MTSETMNSIETCEYVTTLLEKKDESVIKRIEYSNGDVTWRLNGYLHREDGPAIEWPYSDPPLYQWWYHGKKLNCSTQEEFERLMALELFW